MNKLSKQKLVIYIIAILILFGIPIYTILISTNTLKDGTEYYFKIEAYDPYDMFRGNYLDISFEENVIESSSNYLDLEYKDDVYVTIGKRDDGFAYFKSINKTVPNNTENYFKTTAYYRDYYGNGQNGYVVTTPTRYYINEDKSLNAEQLLQENIDNAYVKVRVKNGRMLVVGIYINDVLIDTID